MSAYSDAIDALGPIAQYRLAETTGTTAEDVNNTYDLTYVGTPTLDVPGLIVNDANACVSLNGSSQYADGGSIFNLSMVDYSFVVSAKADAITGVYKTIFSKAIAADGTGRYGLSINPAGYLEAFIDNGPTSVVITSPTLLVADTVYHIVVVVDRSGNFSLYLDGTLEDSTSISSWSATSLVNTYPFRLGAYTAANGTTATNHFNGDIDEFAVYQKVLTAGEVTTLYKVSRGIVSAPTNYPEQIYALEPAIYYRLGEPSGTLAVDEMLAYDGTYVGTPTLGVAGLLVNDADTCITMAGAQYVDTSYLIPATATISAVLSVKVDSVGSNQMFIGDINAGGSNVFSRLTFGIFGANWYINIGDGSGYYTEQSAAHGMAIDTVYHVVITWNGTAFVIYKDGEVSRSGTSTTAMGTLGTQGIRLGVYGDYLGAYYSGEMDDVAVFTKTLTASEVTTLYEASRYIVDSPADYPETVSALEPEAYWRFGESSGTAAIDMMLNKDGVYVGTPTLGSTSLITNDLNTAVTLNGSSQYITTGVTNSVSATSVSLSVKFNSIATKQMLFSEMTSGGSTSSARVRLGINNSTNWFFSLGNGTSTYTNSTTAHNLAINTTYHIVYVINGTSIKIYVDGVKVVDTTSTVALGTASVNPWYIGRVGDFNGQYVNGTIDDVAIYRTALTALNVTHLYNASIDDIDYAVYAAGTVPDVVVTPTTFLPLDYDVAVYALYPTNYWRLGEALAATTAVDEVGTSDGTYVNSPTLESPSLIANDSTDTALSAISNKGATLPSVTDMTTSDFSVSFIFNGSTAGSYTAVLGFAGFQVITGYLAADCFALELPRLGGSSVFGYNHDDSTFDGVTGHIVITWDSTAGEAKYYRDGAWYKTVGTAAGGSGLTVNAIGGTSTNSTVDIKLDEVAVYAKELTATEISDLYDTAQLPPDATAVGTVADVVITPADGWSSRYAGAVMATNPDIYWQHDELTGTVGNDTMGLYDGTYINSPDLGEPGLVTNEQGTSFKVDPSNKYMYLLDNAYLRTVETIMCLCSSSNWTLSTAGYTPLVSKGQGDYNLQVRATDHVLTFIDSGVLELAAGTTTLAVDTVYHVAVVFDNTSCIIYLDGEVEVSATFAARNLYNGTKALELGRDTYSGASANIGNVWLDEVALYDRKLTSTEIVTLSANSHGIYSVGPIADVIVTPVTGTASAGAPTGSGTVADVTVNVIAGTGTVDNTGSGTIADVTVSVITGAATTGITASGTVADVVVSVIAGVATGDALGSGTIFDVIVTPAVGAGTVDNSSAGTVTDVVVTPTDGTATSPGAALGTVSDVIVTPVNGSAIGDITGGLGEIRDINASAASGGAVGFTFGDDYYTQLTDLSPYALWRLGEASGETAYDDIGTNDGTRAGTIKPTFGATSLISGSSDTAVTFTSTSEQRFDLADTTFDGMRTMVFTFEPKVTYSTSINQSGNYLIAGRAFGTKKAALMYLTAGTLVFIYYDDSDTYHYISTGATTFTANQTFNIALRLDGTDGGSIFIDGTEHTVDTGATDDIKVNTTNDCCLGATPGVSGNAINADLDEFALFTTALTDANITALVSAAEGDLDTNANIAASIADVYVDRVNGATVLTEKQATGAIADVIVTPTDGYAVLNNSASGTIANSTVYPISGAVAYGRIPYNFKDGINNSLPEAYWRLGEPSGLIANDETTVYDGTYVGSPTLGVTGLLVNDSDTGVTLNGSSQYVTSTYDFASTGTSDFAIYSIINLTNLTTDHTILAWTADGNALGTTESSITLTVNTSGNIVFVVREDSTTIVTLTTTLTLNTAETYNIVAARTLGILKIHVDGYLDVTTADASAVSIDTVVTGHITTIGRNSESSGSAYLAGTIDEVALFNRALVYQDAKTLEKLANWDTYALHLRETAVPAALHLRLGGPDTNGSNLYDETGNQNPDHVTLNGTGITSHAGLGTTGKNKALEFTDQYNNIEFQLNEELYASPEAAPFMASIVYQRESGIISGSQFLFELGYEATFTKGFSLEISSGGIIVGYNRGSSINAGWTIADINDGNPHHITVALYGAFDSFGNVRLWYDGVDQGLYTGGNKLNVVNIGPGPTGTIGSTSSVYSVKESTLDEFVLFETVPPFEDEIQSMAVGLYNAYNGLYTPFAEGNVSDVVVSTISGTAWTNHGFATGIIADVTVSTIAGTATGDTSGTGTGTVADVIVTPITGQAAVDISTAGTVDDVIVTPAAASANSDNSGLGTVADVIVTPVSGAATGDANVAGTISDVIVSPVTGSAGTHGVAAGLISDVSVSVITGFTTGSANAEVFDIPDIIVYPVSGSAAIDSYAYGLIEDVVVIATQGAAYPNVIPRDHANFYQTINKVLAYSVTLKTQVNESAILNRNNFSDASINMVNNFSDVSINMVNNKTVTVKRLNSKKVEL